jgi:hypothetical protein
MLEIFNSIGQVQSVHTLVDFYQYIKSVEYLICLAFFVAFPAFFRYLHKESSENVAH